MEGNEQAAEEGEVPREVLPPPPPPSDGLGPGSIGRVDWSPLAKLTRTRPQVSKYGLPRWSPMEWRLLTDSVVGGIPSAELLDHESKNIITEVAAACDKEQSENTLRLRQRAVEVTAKHCRVTQSIQELREEVDILLQYKPRLQRAMQTLGVVEGINAECREIRRNRFVEDLVRDEVEEELFQEKALCQEVRQLYDETLKEFDNLYSNIKACFGEVYSLWSDQKETLCIESECIGLNSASDRISFFQGNARYEEGMSTLEIWDDYSEKILSKTREMVEASKAFRARIHSSILSKAAKDLKEQDEKILKAFLKRIDELCNVKKLLEGELHQVLKEIAHAESLYAALDKLGRQVDFNLKVVQTRLEHRRHRPGAEQCADKPHVGLLRELKVICERVTSLQAQMTKINQTIDQMYSSRKKLERQIHVKRHSLRLDQERCMLFRNKFPSNAYLLGY